MAVIDDIMEPILATFRVAIAERIANNLIETYLQADAEMANWGMTKAGFPIKYEGPPLKQAVNWAKRHSAKLVTQMDTETKKRLASVVSRAIEEKRGVPGLARDIRSEFKDMSRRRAQLISQTETSGALEQAFIDRAKSMGVTGKEWVVTDPCPICASNAAEGVVPLNHVFRSGHSRPPAHPGCRCALAPAMIKTRESLKEKMSPNDWKSEYDKGIPHWAEDSEPSGFAKDFVKMMKSNKSKSVLEIGCGNGRDSILFAKSGFLTSSIDIVDKALSLAKKNAKKSKVSIKFKIASSETLPFEDSSFDAVFSLSVLHSTNLSKSLKEVYRVISNGGISFIYIYGDTQFKSGNKPKDVIDWDKYLNNLESIGFKITKSYKEEEKDFDEFGEKHTIYVTYLEKR